jgi:hypothetical protein
VIHERDDVAQDADEERALRALDGAERLDVPIGFAENVMRSVRERAAGGTQLSGPARVLGDKNPEFWSPDRRREPSGGGSMSSRKLLLGIAAVAVIAIGFFAVMGFPPVGPGSDATVGVAKKYQSEQIAAKDVLLQSPEVQRVLQSDTFRKLVTNPETRAILTSKDFQKAMAAAEVRAFMAQARDASVAQALGSALDAKAVSSLLHQIAGDTAAAAEVDAAIKDAAVEKALDRAASKAAENASEKAMDRASEKAIDQALDKAVRDAALEKLLTAAAHDPAFVQLLGNNAFQEALKDKAFLGLLTDASFAKAVSSDPAFMQVISDSAVLEAAKGGLLGAAVDAAAGAASGAAIDKASDAAQGKAHDGAQQK